MILAKRKEKKENRVMFITYLVKKVPLTKAKYQVVVKKYHASGEDVSGNSV